MRVRVFWNCRQYGQTWTFSCLLLLENYLLLGKEYYQKAGDEQTRNGSFWTCLTAHCYCNSLQWFKIHYNIPSKCSFIIGEKFQVFVLVFKILAHQDTNYSCLQIQLHPQDIICTVPPDADICNKFVIRSSDKDDCIFNITAVTRTLFLWKKKPLTILLTRTRIRATDWTAKHF